MISIPNDRSSKQLCKKRQFLLPVFTNMGAASFVTAPLTLPLFDIILASNVTRPKRMPHPTEFFLDLEEHFYILLAITFIGYVICVIVVVGTDTIYFALLQHTCGILAILRYPNFLFSFFNRKYFSFIHDYISAVTVWKNWSINQNVIPYLKGTGMLRTWYNAYSCKSE